MSAEESMFSQENLETVGEAPAKASPAVLHVMVGLPRSGKSTYARSLDIPRVEVDAIRKALTGQAFCEDAEIMVTAITKVMVHALFMAGHTEVLLDEAWTCTAEYRDLWEAYGELEGYKVQYHLIPTCPETCLKRAIAERNGALVETIQSMAELWDFPEPYAMAPGKEHVGDNA